ncbi:MAG: SAM hydrolase/SAM-dependent halogenase family protein [Microcoleaceae cyanobacterium]
MGSPHHHLITLLTDFGLDDVYVGVMKGAIARINPTLNVIDLTHQIPPQNIMAGRFALINAYPFFPAGTVHLAIVDPGVGSTRRAIALQLADGFLVGPDNGLLTGVLGLLPGEIIREKIICAVELNNSDYWRTNIPSNTFHGRDIFAPVAAHLATGVDIQKLGSMIDPASLITLSLPELQISPSQIMGAIQYIDHFGNLVSNIPGKYVEGKNWAVTINSRLIPTGETYSDVAVGEILGLVGSHGWLEIAVHNGHAQTYLDLTVGVMVVVAFQEY